MINGLFLFITGVTLFLFGMVKLSGLMQQLFSSRMRKYIQFSVKKPIYGLLMGITTTILFQSSSATTLLTIGIVSAGLISFYHSLGIILGADIGTTLTVQFVVWNVTSISPIVIFIGGMLIFARDEKWRQAGEAIVYFGLIFFGLELVKNATAPLKDSAFFMDYFHRARNPLMGLGIGIVFTALVHSSAIPISVLAIMGQQNLITIDNAIPIMLGANVGTTATAIMGSIASNLNGKRSAFAHLIFKVGGAVICLIFLPLFIKTLKAIPSNMAQQIALGHFIFNVILSVLFMPFLAPFSAFVKKIFPGEENSIPLWPEYLDSRCLATPEESLICVQKELSRKIALCRKMYTDGFGLIGKFSEAKKRDVNYIELVVNNLQSEIINFLWNISFGQLTPSLSKRLFAFSKIVYEVERIADRSTNIVELSEEKHRRNSFFSDGAKVRLNEIDGLVLKNLADAASLIETKDMMKIAQVFERNRRVQICVKRSTEEHLERFYQNACQAEAGPVFVDILVNLEKISEHCQAIAQCVNGLDDYSP